MSRLLACPFCRELYRAGEHAECPACNVRLVPLEGLPLSPEAQLEAIERGESPDPDDQPFSWKDFRAGRGALMLCGVAGLGLFFCPWVNVTSPEIIRLSGFDLARGNAGWLWGGAVAWVVLIPLMWTRRTRTALRGVRIISALFCLMTTVETSMLWAKAPTSTHGIPVEISWIWGLYASLSISVLGAIIASRLGGRRALIPELRVDSGPAESAEGRTLH